MPQLGSNAGLLTGYLANKRYAVARPLLRGRVLDYGCATGLLTQWCRPDAYLGVDIDQESIDVARRTRPAFRFDIALPEREQFDTVVALALIEHIKDQVSLLETLDVRASLRWRDPADDAAPADGMGAHGRRQGRPVLP